MEQLELPFIQRECKIFQVYQPLPQPMPEHVQEDYRGHVMYVCSKDMLGAEWEASFHFPRWRLHCRIRPVDLENAEKRLKCLKHQISNTEQVIKKVKEENARN